MLINFDAFAGKFNSDGRLFIEEESVVHEFAHQIGFAYSWVPDDDDLEKIVIFLKHNYFDSALLAFITQYFYSP